jgi:hypothetical protein
VILVIDDQNGLHASRDLHWRCESKSETTANSDAKWKRIHLFVCVSGVSEMAIRMISERTTADHSVPRARSAEGLHRDHATK